MRFIILHLLIDLVCNLGNVISEENGEPKEESEKDTRNPTEINNRSEKYDPFSRVYVFKYDLNPLVDEETNLHVPLDSRKLNFSLKTLRSNPGYSPYIVTKHLTGRRKVDLKYLENLMAHPTWFTVFTMEKRKDFHSAQLKHPVLINIENIQEFYKKFLEQAMCMTAKEFSQEPCASNSFLPNTWGYQSIPYFRFNELNYDKKTYRGDIRNQIQQSDVYRTFSNNNRWFNVYNRFPSPSCTNLPKHNRFPSPSCTNLPKHNQWIPKNVTTEINKTEMKEDTKMYTTETNTIRNNYNWSHFPENLPPFVGNPSGIDSNIKAIFGNMDEKHLSAHSKNGNVDNSEETI